MRKQEPAAGFFDLVRRARTTVHDYPALEAVFERAEAKFNKEKARLNTVLDELNTLLRLLKAWATRSYTTVPVRTMALVLGAILYFLLPFDFIPDFILGGGFLDDITVITFVVQSVRKDIERFKVWEAQHTDVIETKDATTP